MKSNTSSSNSSTFNPVRALHIRSLRRADAILIPLLYQIPYFRTSLIEKIKAKTAQEVKLKPVIQEEITNAKKKTEENPSNVLVSFPSIGKKVTQEDVQQWSQAVESRIRDSRAVSENFRLVRDIYTNLKKYTVYEDDDILVVNKPSGIASYDDKDRNRIGMLEIFQNWDGDHLRLAQRMRRGASGLLILTKNKQAQVNLRNQFNNSTDVSLERTFLVLVEGNYGMTIHN